MTTTPRMDIVAELRGLAEAAEAVGDVVFAAPLRRCAAEVMAYRAEAVTAPAWKPNPAKIRLMAIDLLEGGVTAAAWLRLYDLLVGLGGAEDVLAAVRRSAIIGFHLPPSDAARLRQEGEVKL
jgi:hypothetical protein